MQSLIRILSKPPHERSPYELKELLHFFKSNKTFRDLEVDQTELMKVTSQIGFSFNLAGRYIFQYGDQGDYFYIILTGEVHVYVPSELSLQLKADLQREQLALNQL